MKRLILLLGCYFFLANSADAQLEWNSIKQPVLRIQYELPEGWFIGGYVDGEECHCAGGTLNMSRDAKVKLVVYASNKIEIDSLRAQPVWTYHFLENGHKEKIKTAHFSFTKTQSTWTKDNGEVVWRLQTSRGSYNYVIYLIIDKEVVDARAGDIQRIIDSIAPHKV